jgi:mono/diheme cytochrome c family protein
LRVLRHGEISPAILLVQSISQGADMRAIMRLAAPEGSDPASKTGNVASFAAAGLPAGQASAKKVRQLQPIHSAEPENPAIRLPIGSGIHREKVLTSRDVCRLSYAAMVLALTVACTPASDDAAPPAAEAPAITPPADTATGPAASNTEDTLSSAPPEQTIAAAPAASTAPAASPEELGSGRAAYSRTCAMCHGPKGEGTPAAAAIASRDVAVIADKVTKGPINPGDRMPALAAMMSGDEVDDVAKFVAAGFPQ